MDINSINIRWLGTRKDSSSRGAIAGWFVETGQPTAPRNIWEERDLGCARAYTFRGKIGKKMIIEERILNSNFIHEMQGLQKNYRTALDPEKVMNSWGSALNEELSMFIVMLKLKGP